MNPADEVHRLNLLFELRAQAVELAVSASVAGEFKIAERASDDAAEAQNAIDQLLGR